MKTELSITEIRRTIDDSLSPEALAYWNGCGDSIIDEVLRMAQREGVQAAIEELEDLAAEPVE